MVRTQIFLAPRPQDVSLPRAALRGQIRSTRNTEFSFDQFGSWSSHPGLRSCLLGWRACRSFGWLLQQLSSFPQSWAFLLWKRWRPKSLEPWFAFFSSYPVDMSYIWFPTSDRLKSLFTILPESQFLWWLVLVVSWGSQRVISCLQVAHESLNLFTYQDFSKILIQIPVQGKAGSQGWWGWFITHLKGDWPHFLPSLKGNDSSALWPQISKREGPGHLPGPVY